MWYFFPSEGGELIPWCPEVVLYIIQPVNAFRRLKNLRDILVRENLKQAKTTAENPNNCLRPNTESRILCSSSGRRYMSRLNVS